MARSGKKWMVYRETCNRNVSSFFTFCCPYLSFLIFLSSELRKKADSCENTTFKTLFCILNEGNHRELFIDFDITALIVEFNIRFHVMSTANCFEFRLESIWQKGDQWNRISVFTTIKIGCL